MENFFNRVWYRPKFIDRIFVLFLIPFSIIYLIIFYLIKFLKSQKKKFDVQIICFGNINTGGTGKTSTILSLLEILKPHKRNIVVLLRGYKSEAQSIMKVNIEDDPNVVGDEALLYAKKVCTYIGKNRSNAIEKLIDQENPDLILLDDGFQDNSIFKNLNFLVINGSRGFGNNLVLPAGPLREPVQQAIKKTDGLILIGNDERNIIEKYNQLLSSKLIINANIQTLTIHKSQMYYAFSGIGNNENFIKTLQENKINPVMTKFFPDHYHYNKNDIQSLISEAKNLELQLITTEKDFIKIPKEYQNYIECLKINIEFNNENELLSLIRSK